jgi:UDP-3-O-[3-hydroxymyristoyl] glucosamine N-acyltransferase
MTQPVFFKHGPGLTMAEIAALTGAVAPAGGGADRRFFGVAALEDASPHDVSFAEKGRVKDRLAVTRAGACFVPSRLAGDVPAGVAALVTEQPYRALVNLAAALFPDALRPSSLYEAHDGVESAFVHPAARLESGVTIDPGASIGARAEIGAGTVVGANAVVGPDVRIGRDCTIGPGSSIMHALIGDRVILHPGCRIGQDGFGFLPGWTHQKIPQVGRVIIQNDVEIGANSTIDRGGLRDTVIGEGSKIDNLVQIGHNVMIGRHCLIAGQVGISGSSTIGDYVMLGGQVGIADNAVIGEGAQLAARAAVASEVPAGGRWGGTPARPMREWVRSEMILARMAKRSAGKDEGSDE